MVHKESLTSEKRLLAQQLANGIAQQHNALWPGHKNGRPEKIRDYIEERCREDG